MCDEKVTDEKITGKGRKNVPLRGFASPVVPSHRRSVARGLCFALREEAILHPKFYQRNVIDEDTVTLESLVFPVSKCFQDVDHDVFVAGFDCSS